MEVMETRRLAYIAAAIAVLAMSCYISYREGAAAYYDEAVLWRQRALLVFDAYQKCQDSHAMD